MTRLLLVPLDDAVVFPGMSVTLAVDTADEERVLLVPRHENEFAAVGTVATVSDTVRLPGGARAVVVEGLHRGIAGAAVTEPNGRLYVDVEERPDPVGQVPSRELRELEREYRAVVEEILELLGADSRIQSFLRGITEPGALADATGYSPDLNYEQRIELLQEVDVLERLRLAVTSSASVWPSCRSASASATTSSPAPRSSSASTSCASRWTRSAASSATMTPPWSRSTAPRSRSPRCPMTSASRPRRNSAGLERVGEQSGESSVIRTYLDWLLAVPWSKRSEERLDPEHAREVLDADHAGLEDVKDRIVEYIAVKKLRQERGITEDKRSGAILTLLGPPGTGKTSIGESIARATGREFIRISLGGVRDEAEIRGHRRTYIGALPGRLVRALRDAGTMNPVIMLDEVDKVGADWRGDPASALLEVLDPAQNHSFRDHYLDVELDLSGVMFIATANVADTIPGPLLDRMEVIHFDGYTTSEKVAIARGYLWPRQLDRNGLRAEEVEVSDELLRTIVTEYTREAGVRNLEREIGTLLRKTATQVASGTAPLAPVEISIDAVRDALGRQRFFPGVSDPHGGPWRGDRPGGDRRRR